MITAIVVFCLSSMRTPSLVDKKDPLSDTRKLQEERKLDGREKKVEMHSETKAVKKLAAAEAVGCSGALIFFLSRPHSLPAHGTTSSG
jgi:hypothetical protein